MSQSAAGSFLKKVIKLLNHHIEQAPISLYFWIIFLVHFTIAIFYKEIVGVSITPDTKDWDWFWQTLPADALQANMIESIWHLHSQPPFYNLYGAFFIKLFYPHHLQAMHYTNILLGSFLSGMIYVIMFKFTHNKTITLLTALCLALNPSLILFEAYILYTLLAAFLVTLTIFFLALYAIQNRLRYIYAFIFFLNLLILSRSLYHLVILLIGIPLACIVAGKQWFRILVISVLISLLSIGWYGKNYLQFGFFGASSWSGLGLWKIASKNNNQQDLERLVQANVITSTVVDVDVFSRPSHYLRYGFNATSNIDVLSRDDYNNINIIAISEMYLENALRLIAHDPIHYAKNIGFAYLLYTQPTSRYTYLSPNVAKISWHENLSSQVIQGQGLAQRLTGYGFGLFLTILLPVSLLTYFRLSFQICGISVKKWFVYVQTNSALFFTTFIILYTTAVSISMEFAENDRFKFLIEQMLWVFIVSVLYIYITTKSRNSPLS